MNYQYEEFLENLVWFEVCTKKKISQNCTSSYGGISLQMSYLLYKRTGYIDKYFNFLSWPLHV